MINRLADIINVLENAIIDADWVTVEDAVRDLNFLHEDMQSLEPFEYNPDD